MTPEDEIYLRPSSVQPVDPDDQMPEPLPVPAPLRALPGRNLDGEGEEQDEREEETEGEAASYAEGYDTKRLSTKQGTLEELINGQIAAPCRAHGDDSPASPAPGGAAMASESKPCSPIISARSCGCCSAMAMRRH